MIIVPFKSWHLEKMVVQPAQRALLDNISFEILKTLEQTDAFTAMEGDDVLACAGFMEFYPGRGEGWSYLSANIKPHMVEVVRAIKRYLDMHPCRRQEITVDADFPEGHRMAKILGFTLEAPRMRCYDLAGRDRALYARVRENG